MGRDRLKHGAAQGQQGLQKGEKEAQMECYMNTRGMTVVNLPKSVLSEASVQQEFEALMEVTKSIKYQICRVDKSATAVCSFYIPGLVEKAIKSLHGTEFHGHHLLAQSTIGFLNEHKCYENCVFVSNLPKNSSIEDIWKFFEGCGSILSIVIKPYTIEESSVRRVKIRFLNSSSIDLALNLNESAFLGSTISVVVPNDKLTFIFRNLGRCLKYKAPVHFINEINAIYSHFNDDGSEVAYLPDQESYDKALSLLEGIIQSKNEKGEIDFQMSSDQMGRALLISNLPKDAENLHGELIDLVGNVELLSFNELKYSGVTVVTATCVLQTDKDVDKVTNFLHGYKLHGCHLMVQRLSEYENEKKNYNFVNAVGVSKIPPNTSEEDLWKFFKKCRTIRTIKWDRDFHCFKGGLLSACIDFDCPSKVVHALAQSGHDLLGSPVSVVALHKDLSLEFCSFNKQSKYKLIGHFMQDVNAVFCYKRCVKGTGTLFFENQQAYNTAMSDCEEFVTSTKEKGNKTPFLNFALCRGRVSSCTRNAEHSKSDGVKNAAKSDKNTAHGNKYGRKSGKHDGNMVNTDEYDGVGQSVEDLQCVVHPKNKSKEHKKKMGRKNQEANSQSLEVKHVAMKKAKTSTEGSYSKTCLKKKADDSVPKPKKRRAISDPIQESGGKKFKSNDAGPLKNKQKSSRKKMIGQ